MADFGPIRAVIVEFQRQLFQEIDKYSESLQRELTERIRKQVERDRELEFSAVFRKLSNLDKKNVQDFLRLVKALEAIEKAISHGRLKSQDEMRIKNEYDLTTLELKCLQEIATIGRLYEKIKENKARVIDFL